MDYIKVTYKSTSNAYIANQYLAEIAQHLTFSADFEVAVKYTPEMLAAFQEELNSNPSRRRQIELNSMLNATALDHASHCTITHCSIAINDHEGYVFILDNPKITKRVLQFLVTTTIKQVWHNASYDFRHLYYHTGKMPLNYEDTQLLAKTILNHVEVHKAQTGLKQLAGHRYGAWGLSEDNFTLEHMYDERMLQYAATDACSCYWLWNSINSHLEETNV